MFKKMGFKYCFFFQTRVVCLLFLRKTLSSKLCHNAFISDDTLVKLWNTKQKVTNMEKRYTRVKGGCQSGREIGPWSIARMYYISVYKCDIINEQNLLIKK